MYCHNHSFTSWLGGIDHLYCAPLMYHAQRITHAVQLQGEGSLGRMPQCLRAADMVVCGLTVQACYNTASLEYLTWKAIGRPRAPI